MRAKVLQYLTVLILAVGMIGTPMLGRGGPVLNDCTGGSSSSCGGG